MLKMLTAFTLEIDDVDLAIEEIKAQIDFEKELMKCSVGLVTCYSEFIDSGVVEKLCEVLPFDVIGCTTSSSGTEAGISSLALSLTVLTADDVVFETVLTQGLTDSQEEKIKAAYDAAKTGLKEEPKLALAFMPLIFTVDGEVFLEAMDSVSGHLPIFATLAVDHTRDYRYSTVICNGKSYKDAMAMVLIGGNVQPKFVVGGLPMERILKQQAIITDSHANILKEVNGIPVVEYLKNMGLTTEDGKVEGVTASPPFVLDYRDGTDPVVRAIFAQTPEGHAVCGARVPVGATLAISAIDHDVVLDVTAKVMETIKAQELNGVLLFSCIGRNYALGANLLDELDLILKNLGGKTPFMAAYSGGEVCPMYDKQGHTKNRFHNNTIIACIL